MCDILKFSMSILDNFNEAFSIIVTIFKNILSNGLNMNVNNASGYMIKVTRGTKYKFIIGESRFILKKLFIIMGALDKKAIKEITKVLLK